MNPTIYRIYAPFHGVLAAGTLEYGVFDSLGLARRCLKEIADRVYLSDEVNRIFWQGDDEFAAVHRATDGAECRVHYGIRSYPLNTPLAEQFFDRPAPAEKPVRIKKKEKNGDCSTCRHMEKRMPAGCLANIWCAKDGVWRFVACTNPDERISPPDWCPAGGKIR